jgi:hypothetical protein
MSLLGQSRRFAGAPAASGLPPDSRRAVKGRVSSVRAINGPRGVLTGVKQTATSGRRSQYREQVSTSRGTPIEAIAHSSASRQKFWLGCVCAVLSACRAFTHIARANASGRRNRVTPMQRLPNAAKVSAQTGSRAAAVVSRYGGSFLIMSPTTSEAG